jgi:predicted enzyme related to lactoylglutathione lyase
MSKTQQRAEITGLRIVSLVVDDVDEAIEFYTQTLGFEVKTDGEFEMDGRTGRWVTVGVPGQDVEISLVEAEEPYYDENTQTLLASKRGTETWWTFRTPDCETSVAALRDAGVEITQEPRTYPWGTEAMFADPSGNQFSLFEYGE